MIKPGSKLLECTSANKTLKCWGHTVLPIGIIQYKTTPHWHVMFTLLLQSRDLMHSMVVEKVPIYLYKASIPLCTIQYFTWVKIQKNYQQNVFIM